MFLILAACGGGTAATPVATAPKPVPAPPSPKPPAVKHAQGNPSPSVPTRLSFFQNPVNTSVRISPDGKRLAWIVPRNNIPLPVFAPIDDLKSTTPLATDTTRPVTGVFWTPDNAHLLYFQDPAGDGNSHVFRYDIAESKATDLIPIKGARIDLIGMSPRKPNVLIVGINDRDPAYDDIYSVDLKTGDKKRIVLNTDGVSQFSLDNDLAIRIGTKYLPDGTAQLLAFGPKGFELWDSIGAEDRDGTKFLGIDVKGKTGWMLDSRGRDTAAVFAVDLKTKAKKLISDDPHVDATSAFVNPMTLELAAVGYNYLRPAWKLVDKSLSADLAALDGLNAGSWELTSASADGKLWVVGFANDVQPGTFYLYDHKTHASKRLMTMTPALDGQPLSRMHSVVVPARDGVELVAFVTVPKDHDHDGVPDHPMPTVMLIGPDPAVHLTWVYDQLHQWLASRGYVVVTSNTRTSIGFGKKRYVDSARQWGRKMQDDITDTTKWAIDNKIADPAKIAIVGVSYGGYAAVMGLESMPDLYTCGVDILGPTDLNAYARALAPQYAQAFIARIGDPLTPAGADALRAVSPLSHAGAITKPLLVIHSADRLLGADKLVDALAGRHAPVSYVEFPDEKDANVSRPENNLAMLAIVEAYLSDQIGGYFEPLEPDIAHATSAKPGIGAERIPGF